MNNLPCEVVRDLLPSYVDGLTSETTNNLVDGHIETCEPCRAALEAMRAPEETPPEGKTREIDYLKKNKKRNRAVVAWSIAGALLLAFTVLFVRMFLIGEELYGDAVPTNIRVEGNHLSADIDCVNSFQVISDVRVEEKDGVLMLRVKGAAPGLLPEGRRHVEYEASAPISEVRTPVQIYWVDGATISKLASDVYLTRHDYVGDMSANARTAQALRISELFGPYENELQTSERPYCWTFKLQSDFAAQDDFAREQMMDEAAYILLATVGNLDVVAFDYTVDGTMFSHREISADYASKLFGRDIKSFAESPKALEELITEVRLW
ncbi:MAG: DUF4825 domain-containing protein [Ruminococcaceae bacterium]|nr:DUF4825 domain-containing protein [Oscillospiraceae bacterium]